MDSDWELLDGSDSDSIASEKKLGSSSVIDDGMILSDHFSVETSDFVVESGNSGEVRADLSSDHVDVRRSGDSGDGEVRISDFEASDEKHLVVAEVTSGTVSHYEDDHIEGRHVEDSSKSWFDSEGKELVSGDSGVVSGDSGNLGEVRADSSSDHMDVASDSDVRMSDFEPADEKHLESEAVSEITSGTVSHYEDDHIEGRHVEDSSKFWSDSEGNKLVSGDSGVVNVDSRNSGEVRVDLSSDHLDVRRSGDSGDGEVRMSDFEHPDEKHLKSEVVAELSGGTVSRYEDDHIEGRHVESSEESELVSGDSDVVNGEEEILSDDEAIEGSEGNTVEVVAGNSALRSDDGSKSRETVWWKTPFVILKYCAIRIGPVWSVSMAAAVMGLVILGRRLYSMRKKAQRFNIKVTIDDKKVSRAMSQAARLNEMFTEVRRVPVIRPTLPSPGTWPALTLR